MGVSPHQVLNNARQTASLLISEAFPIPTWKRLQEGKASGSRLTSRSCWTPPKIRITPSISCSRRRAQCCILCAERREVSGGLPGAWNSLAQHPEAPSSSHPFRNQSAPMIPLKSRPGGPGAVGAREESGLEFKCTEGASSSRNLQGDYFTVKSQPLLLLLL